jgi:predicted AAA+ superfamily ATPase
MDELYIRGYANLHNFSMPKRVTVLYGARRVGKTTLINRYLDGLRKQNRILRVTGDNLSIQNLLSSQESKTLLDWSAGYNTVFIDEAQRIPNVGWSLKILIDAQPGLNIIATGSSSFRLIGTLGEPLTGRQIPLKLYPLAVSELRCKHNNYELRQNLDDMLIFGMYPEVRAAQSPEQKRRILDELVQAYLLKDILELERVKNPKILSDLLILIALQIGSEVSINELSNTLKVDFKTVTRYIDLLEKCFVLYNLRGFSRNLRNEVTKMSKYYFYDTGVRNAVIQNYNPLLLRNDAGALWENFAFMERVKFRAYTQLSARDYFWRTWEKQEIDLLEEYGGQLHASEFKWSPKKSPKIPRAFKEAYPEATFQTITPDNFFEWV